MRTEKALEIVCMELDSELIPIAHKTLGRFPTYEHAEPRYRHYLNLAKDKYDLVETYLSTLLTEQKRSNLRDASLIKDWCLKTTKSNCVFQSNIYRQKETHKILAILLVVR